MFWEKPFLYVHYALGLDITYIICEMNKEKNKKRKDIKRDPAQNFRKLRPHPPQPPPQLVLHAILHHLHHPFPHRRDTPRHTPGPLPPLQPGDPQGRCGQQLCTRPIHRGQGDDRAGHGEHKEAGGGVLWPAGERNMAWDCFVILL